MSFVFLLPPIQGYNVDASTEAQGEGALMGRTAASDTRKKPRRADVIIGFRLPQALAQEVKAEAARRGVKLNALFQELWADYRRRRGSS